MSEVKVKENESLDSALRRFKRTCARDGIMGEVRKREHNDKPSVKRKKKSEAARKRKFKEFYFILLRKGMMVMSLKEQLFADLKTAMKEKDTVRKDTVQLIRSGILQIEKDKKIELDEDGVLDVIAKQLKSRRDSLPEYEKSGRQDLIEKLNREIEILLGYLPEQLSEDEIQKIVAEAVAESGAASVKEMGKVMAIVTPKVKGRADNKVVGNLVRKMLQGK